MSYQHWLKSIEETGVSAESADPSWLNSQFRSGASPVVVAQTIRSGQYPRTQSVQTPRKPKTLLAIIGLFACLVCCCGGILAYKMQRRHIIFYKWRVQDEKTLILSVENGSDRPLHEVAFFVPGENGSVSSEEGAFDMAAHERKEIKFPSKGVHGDPLPEAVTTDGSECVMVRDPN